MLSSIMYFLYFAPNNDILDLGSFWRPAVRLTTTHPKDGCLVECMKLNQLRRKIWLGFTRSIIGVSWCFLLFLFLCFTNKTLHKFGNLVFELPWPLNNLKSIRIIISQVYSKGNNMSNHQEVIIENGLPTVATDENFQRNMEFILGYPRSNQKPVTVT